MVEPRSLTSPCRDFVKPGRRADWASGTARDFKLRLGHGSACFGRVDTGYADGMAMHWQWTRFDGLGVQGLYDVLALRCRVFILEQGPYLDPDGLDQRAWHLLGRDEPGGLVAYLRAVDPGVKFDEPSIGRVIVAPEARGTGLGPVLMREGLARCAAAWPGRANRISAQAHLRVSIASSGSRPCPANTSRTTYPTSRCCGPRPAAP